MCIRDRAAIVKYPFSSNLAGSHGKFGFFESEREDLERIAEDLGMRCLEHGEGTSVRYARHPLVFLMEAADDTCYEIMDIEDAHKLHLLSFEETADPVSYTHLDVYKRQELQEKKAQRVIAFIFGALIFLGLCFLVYTTILMN